MPHHYYSNPSLRRISSNLTNALLGSAQDDRAIAGARYDDARALGKERQNEFVNTLVNNPGLARHFAAKQMGVTPDELDAIAGDSLGAFSGRFFGGDNPQQLTQGISNALRTQPQIQAELALAGSRQASGRASDALAGKYQSESGYYDQKTRGEQYDADIGEINLRNVQDLLTNPVAAKSIAQALNLDPTQMTPRDQSALNRLTQMIFSDPKAKGLMEALQVSAQAPVKMQQEEQQLAEDTEAVKTQEAKTSKQLKGVEKIDAEIKNIEETRKKLEEQTRGEKINNANDALKQIGISLDNSAKLVKVRQEKEKLLKLEIEKVTAQHGADSAEALTLIRNETVNKVKLEQELVKIRVLNERKMGLAERQNMAAKTSGERAKTQKTEEEIQTVKEERPGRVAKLLSEKEKLDAGKTKIEEETQTVKEERPGKVAKLKSEKEKLDAGTSNLVERTDLVKSQKKTVDEKRPGEVREQEGKADLAGEKVTSEQEGRDLKKKESLAKRQNLSARTNLTRSKKTTVEEMLPLKKEEKQSKIESNKALEEKRKRTTTSSGGKPLKVSAGDHKKFQALVQERRDEYDNFDDIPEVVRKKLRRKATDVFGDSFSGRAGETRGDFMKSANVGLDSLPEFNGDVHQIDTGFFDDLDDFAIPGHTYNELRKVFTLKGEEANEKAREWYDKLEEQGYTKEQITAIFKDVKP